MGYLRGFRRAGLAWRSVRLNTYLLRLLPAEDQKLVRARMEEAGSGANFYFESLDGLYAVFEHRYGQRHYICRGESKADAGKLVFSLGDLT